MISDEKEMMTEEDLAGWWACDFETTTEIDYKAEGRVRVYLWHARSMDETDSEMTGYDIQSFLDWVINDGDHGRIKMCVFHNLKFDGSYILDAVLRQKWQYGGPNQRGTRKHPTRIVETLITDLGQWMSMSLKVGTHVTRFMDSAKKFPGFSLQKLADLYQVEGKSHLDVYSRRPEGRAVTDEEIERVKGDTRILRTAMRSVLMSGAKKLTMASDAKQWYTDEWNSHYGTMAQTMWKRVFPPMSSELNRRLRKAYNAGWVYLSEAYRGRIIEDVHVYDVNSMYPAQMMKRMPYGLPIRRQRPQQDDWYIVNLKASFKLKKGKLPFLHEKRSMYMLQSEFITDSDGIRELTMSCTDYLLFHECYDVDFEVEHTYWCFRTMETPFKRYIDHWMDRKKHARNPEEKATAKRYLNSLYGKLAENSEKMSKVPYFDDESNRVKFEIAEAEGHTWYLPMAIAITSYARTEIVHFAQRFGSRFVYSDTDSVHVIGEETPEGMPIDPKELGKWKHESASEKARYVGAKKYVHVNSYDPGKPDEVTPISVACAGMPDGCKEGVTLENFKSGAKYPGKLMGSTVPGGYLLSNVEYTIRV